MTVSELPSTWPPVVCDSGSPSVTPDLRDVVVSVENKGSGKLIVRLRKNEKYGQQYAITLNLPEDTFQGTLFSIIRNKGTTLREVGAIKIA
jgi:hypothetical protein